MSNICVCMSLVSDNFLMLLLVAELELNYLSIQMVPTRCEYRLCVNDNNFRHRFSWLSNVPLILRSTIISFAFIFLLYSTSALCYRIYWNLPTIYRVRHTSDRIKHKINFDSSNFFVWSTTECGTVMFIVVEIVIQLDMFTLSLIFVVCTERVN